MKPITLTEQTYTLLDKYSANQDYPLGKNLKQIVSASENAEIIIPVLGMQGMGKSTMINALLGENILPNDADETTCVPVEVKFGTEEKAEVFFRGKDTTVKANTREELNLYVDNNENPANKKGVSHIVLYRNRDLLKSGITIVDLPGVGSLTQENQETTTRYIKNLCTAIFVIPTVPTIRRMEATFIKAVWSQFSKAVFVQNDWGESKREIEESVDFNSKVLKKIAKEIGAEYDGEILVVNAYNALTGSISKNKQAIDSSNIGALTSKINELSGNWESELEASIKNRSLGFIQSAKEEILRRLSQLEMQQEEFEEARQQEYELFKSGTKKLKSQISQIEDYLRTQKEYLTKFVKENAKDCAGKIRVEIHRVIDNNVYDGDKLSQAFSDIQSQYCTEFTDTCFTELMKIRCELSNFLEGIEETLSEENKMKIESIDFYKEKTVKFENAITPVFEIGAGIGGFFAGSAAGGAIAGLSALGAAAGPLGIIAGAVVGVVITAVGGLIGKFLTGGIRKSRGSAVKDEIEPIIAEIETSMKKEVMKGYDEMCGQVNTQLNMFIENRSKEEKQLLSRTMDDSTENSFDKDELNGDLESLIQAEGRLVNV